VATSVFIAKLLGPVFAAVGLALLLRAEHFRAILSDFLHSPALHYLAGFLGLLSGLALILTHNVWVFDWRLIITLIGWLVLIRAVITIFWPDRIVALGEAMLRYHGALRYAAAVNLILGLLLSYFGYRA